MSASPQHTDGFIKRFDSPNASTTKKPRKRNRVPISCTICRRRKVKCDKKKPQCTNCIKNGVQNLCRYLEPKWAKPLDEDEILIPGTMMSNSISYDSADSHDHNSHISNNINNDEFQKELEVLKNKIKDLENENNELKKKSLSTTPTPNLASNENKNSSNNNNVLRYSKNPDSSDLLDCIFNSNILFIARKGPIYNFPISYQISVLSWMFIVRNDVYLNDLWLKILKLRQHYEFYYSSKNAMLDSSKNLVPNYKNYDYKLNKIKGQEKISMISTEKTNEHTSKLKNFLEGNLKLHNNGNGSESIEIKPTNKPNEIEIQSCPVLKNSILTSNASTQNVCPVTGSVGVCPVGNNNTGNIDNANNNDNNNHNNTNHNNNNHNAEKLGIEIPMPQPNNSKQHLVFTKCPVLHPNDVSLAYVEQKKANPSTPLTQEVHLTDDDNDNDEDNDDDDEIGEDPKVCPLMIGDAKALFKEKLSKMNISAIRGTYIKRKSNSISLNSPLRSNSTPVIPTYDKSGPSTPMSAIKPEDTEKLTQFVPIAMKPETPEQPILKRPFSMVDSTKHQSQLKRGKKKLKTISPSAIKNLNYNNTKQVISVIERNLPNRKIVCLLIDRFFEKLYIHLPYVDEQSFRLKINAILNSTDATSQKIKLSSSIGSQYCEEFLNVCLMLIIIRLSWLSLPSKIIEDLTQNELLLMKPENFVTMVLVDMVKEVFSSAKILSKPSLIIFQVALFLKFYNTLSPEDGFDLDDSYANNSLNSSTTTGSSGNNTPGTPSTPTTLNSNDLSGDLTNESPNMNSPNFMAMIVQLAHTIGLNRDPLNFKNFYPMLNNEDPRIAAKLFRKRHLWRKLWYGLVCLTIESNLSLGDYKKGLPIEIDLDPTLGSNINRTWDCRLPGGVEQGVLEKSFENGKTLQRELCVVQNFRESIGVYRWISKGMKCLFDVDKPPVTKEVEKVVNKLMEIIGDKSKIGLGLNIIMTDVEINNPSGGRNSTVWIKKYTKQIKLFRLRLNLIVRSMVFGLNYLLFLNHEQKLNKLISEKNSTLEKIEKQREYIETFFENTLLLAIDNFNVFIQFIDNSNQIFPNCSADLIIYPFLMILNHRSHEFLISLILRIQQNSPVIMEILSKNKIDPTELLKRLFTYMETFLEKLDKLTKSYYYAWGLKKMVKFFYNILTNSQKFFKINFKKMTVKEDKVDSELEMNKNGNNNNNNKNNNQNSTNGLESGKFSMEANSIDMDQKNIPMSAFEIAFGTSRLPPVTDYNNDNSMGINNLGMGINMNLSNLSSMNSISNHMNMNMEMNMNMNGMDNIIEGVGMDVPRPPLSMGLSSLIDNHSMSKGNSDTVSVSSGTNGRNGSVFGTIGEELNELFDDQFLNEIGGFNVDESGQFDGIMKNKIFDNAASQNNLNPNMGLSLHNVSGNNNRDEIYNSLNEIDFTNVDLNAQLDGLDYGFGSDSKDAHSQNGGSNGGHNTGLNNWGLFQ